MGKSTTNGHFQQLCQSLPEGSWMIFASSMATCRDFPACHFVDDTVPCACKMIILQYLLISYIPLIGKKTIESYIVKVFPIISPYIDIILKNMALFESIPTATIQARASLPLVKHQASGFGRCVGGHHPNHGYLNREIPS